MKAHFLTSALDHPPEWRDPRGKPYPEIAIAGRSNVGKSSLINDLTRQKNLAKTSSVPGKTQLINFFLLEERFILADLPGYGFASAPTEAQKKWSEAIDRYLNTRPQLRLLLLLLDIRRTPDEREAELIAWASHKKLPLFLILTKTDKLSEREKGAKLQEASSLPVTDLFSYSIFDPKARITLLKKIEAVL